jgi:hypothetical protein
MNNQIVLQGCLKEFIEHNELDCSEQEAFEVFSILQLTKKLDLTYDEVLNSIVDGGSDGGIDVFMILVNDVVVYSFDQLDDIKITKKTDIKLYILQNKYKSKFEEKALDRLYISMPLIFNLDITEDELLQRFNPKLVELILIFKAIWLKGVVKKVIPEIKFGYLCKADTVNFNKAFESKMKQIINISNESIKGSKISFDLYSSSEINEMYREVIESEKLLIFKENPMPIEFNNEQYGYIGIVQLSNYYDFITDDNNNIIETMFENNVRHYQGNVEVNKKIADSIANDYERDFWWLNNGVTIIVSESIPSPKRLLLSNIQIINGLQTSYIIGKNYNKNIDDKRSILVKIIINNNKETIDKIISASNSQTIVRPDVLRATDSIQRNIEYYLLDKGYYYDRRKNYYKNMGKPIKKIFSILKTAQSVEAILNKNMSVSRSSPTSLLKSEKTYRNIFNESINLNIYLVCNLIWLKVKECINKSDPKVVNVLKNFTYHITRISTSIYFGKVEYSSKDLEGLRIQDIDMFDINTSIKILFDILENYKEDYPNDNIINISKSKKFVQLINNDLYKHFNFKYSMEHGAKS